LSEAHPFDGAIVIAGPTASGKTELAIDLAERIGAEIIGADSQQLYADLPIATCQPSAGQRARVPHHLIGVLPSQERMSAARYGALAREAAKAIAARGKRVLLVGGTGFYLRAAIEGLYEGPAADVATRAALEAEAAREGRAHLHARLAQVDPEAAARLSPNDLRRVIRALEVYELTGESQTSHHRRHRRQVPTVGWFAIDVPRPILYERIQRRTQQIFDGLVAEARALREGGFTRSPAARALGVSEALRFLGGDLSREDALALTVQATRRYAKRQLTWFRGVKAMHWLSVGEPVPCPSGIP